MELLLLGLILLFNLSLRMIFTTSENNDEWVSLWHLQRQKRANWVNYRVNDSIVSGIYSYPVLPHFIVSRFPEKYWMIIGRFLNAFYDIITAIVVYMITKWISIKIAYPFQIAGLSLALLAALLFLTTPILLPVTARMKTIKARSMGLLLNTLFFIVIGLLIIDGSWFYGVIAISIGLLIILSSMFGLQVMLFFAIFLSIYLLSLYPITISLLTLFIGYLIPKLGTREALQFMWHHKYWYLRNYKKGTTASNRNNLKDILLLPKYAFTNFSKFIYLCFFKITPIIGLYSAPSIFFLLIMWIFPWGDWGIVDTFYPLKYLWGLVLASLVTFIFTSLPYLSFFGQAERYFEYCTPASSILFSILLTRLPFIVASNLFWAFFLFHLIIICITFLIPYGQKLFNYHHNMPKDLQEVIDWSLDNLSEARIPTVPCKLGFLYSSNIRNNPNNFKFYYKFILRKGEKGFQYYEDDTGGFQKKVYGWTESKEVLRATPDELHKKYGVTHLLVEKQFLEGLYRTWDGLDIQFMKNAIFENDNFLIYEIR